MGAKSDIDMRVLGPIRVHIDGTPVHLSERLLGLLAMLTMSANRVVSRTALFDALWPDLDEGRAANNLGYSVAELRKRLGETGSSGGSGWIHTEAPGYRLEATNATLDALRFDQLLDSARHTEHPSRSAALAAYDEAISVWTDTTGTAYRDLEHAEFCQLEIHRLRERWVSAVEEQGAIHLELGTSEAILPRLVALTSAFPYRERLWAQRMTALYRTGRQAEALRIFAQVRDLLGETMGIEPSSELRALEEKVLLQSPDLDESPEDRSRISPVPRSLRPLIGRDADVATVSRWLGDRPLVTLVGLGGVGKTRLAEEVARVTSPSFEAAAVFVDLTKVTEPDSVAGAIAAACGLRQQPGRPSIDLVVEFLRIAKRMLVLDNCEHLLPSLQSEVRRILEDVHDVSILATSRIPIGLQGELVHRVRPLAVSDDGGVAPALRLLVDAVGTTEPMIDQHENSAAELVTRLGGIPLAIELAARQLSVMTADQLIRELDSAPDQRSGLGAADASTRAIQDACEWGYRVLDDATRSLFRLLSVTTGGVSPELLELLVPEPTDRRAPAAERIGRLVRVGLVELQVHHTSRGDRTRWAMLEPVRQFAVSCHTDDTQFEEATLRHARAAARLASTFARSMMLDQRTAESISHEEANFVTAIQRSLAAGLPELAASIACSLDYYWVFAGRAREGRRWVERTCEAFPDLADSSADMPDALLRASLTRSRGFLASIDRDYASGVVHLERSIDLLDSLIESARNSDGADSVGPIVRSAAWSRLHLARSLTASYFSRYGFERIGEDRHLIERADALYRRAEADLHREGFDRDRAYVLPFLGWNAVIGEIDEPEQWFQQAISLAEAEGLEIPRGIGQVILAWFLLVEGSQLLRARRLLNEASEAFRNLGDMYSLHISLTVTAVAALATDDREAAVAALAEALDLMALQGGQEWGHLTLGLAAVALADRESHTRERVIRWLDARSPGWRRALASSGADVTVLGVADATVEDLALTSETQISRLARDELLVLSGP